MSEDSESESGNLDIILKTLQSKNYTVKCFKVISTDYGLPTRRVRLYLGGFSNRKQPNASFALVEQLLCLCKLKHQPPDSWISCSDEPTELQSFGSWLLASKVWVTVLEKYQCTILYQFWTELLVASPYKKLIKNGFSTTAGCMIPFNLCCELTWCFAHWICFSEFRFSSNSVAPDVRTVG